MKRASRRRRGSGIHRIGQVRVVGVPTPAAVGLTGKRPRALRPMAGWHHPTPCLLCDSRCCATAVCINVVDLARLALVLRVTPASLVELVHDHASALTRPAVVEGRSVHLILRRRPLDGFDSPACHMLARPGGAWRCGVHGVRPGICRAYPFQFTTDRSDEIFSVGEPALCPTSWAMQPTARRGVEAEILRWRQENDVAERLVRDWSRTRGEEGPEAFFRYVLERGGRYLKLDSKPLLDREQASRRLGRALW